MLPTNKLTDKPTDTASYRGALSHLITEKVKKKHLPAKGAAMMSATMTTQILPATPIFGTNRSEMTPPNTQPREPEVAGTHDIHDAISVVDMPAI